MIEVVPLKKLDSEISVLGSKYIANRVLILTALAEGTSMIKNVPENDDIDAAIEALKKFGVDIKKENGVLEINGTNGKISAPNDEIDVKDSGTLMRFITGFASIANGKSTITGSERIQQRPILDLLKSLNDLGVDCNSVNNGFPPIEIKGGTLNGGTTKIKGNVSSQFISSLLLIAPYAKDDVEIIVESDLVSKNYVDMTISLMKEFNVEIERDYYGKFKIKSNQNYTAKEFTIPADWSTTNYFLAAAAIVPGKIKVNDLDTSAEGEAKFIDILKQMNCKIKKNDDSIEIEGNENLAAVEVDMSTMPDSVQTLAAVAVFAKGTTKIKNIGNLKYKESDRITDTANELKKLGINAIAKEDELIIEGGKPNSTAINPHNDHRMAMSFALIGLKTGIKIENQQCVNKSFPQFWDKLKDIETEIKNFKNIVLMGYRGSGKTSVAIELGKNLNRKTINTDNEIINKVGPLNNYIKNSGWEKFRDVESEVIENINGNNLIIDGGGGFIEREKNIQNLKKNGIIIWLKASIQTIKERIKDNKERPSLTETKSFIDEIQEVLQKRTPTYKKAADFEIDTDNKSIEQIAKEILKLIKNP
tara:strand:+ start:19204 stop:20973 length:1770 start_codon:yes stop_codon:yes gene_type:complete